MRTSDPSVVVVEERDGADNADGADGGRHSSPESREGAAARRMSLGFGGAEGREEEGPAEEFVAWTAQKVQAWFRGRREAQAFDVKRRAAISIQRAWRRKIGGLTQRPSLEAAAGVIQRSYRRHRDRAVYQYYRDLIRLRENADTAQMLCSINPTEGQLAESATGLHVRFRLGGESFPPHIMYKVYTHRPVTDIGSFCPRNYVQERAVTTKELHNKAPAGGVDVLVLEGGEATTTGGGGGAAGTSGRRTTTGAPSSPACWKRGSRARWTGTSSRRRCGSTTRRRCAV